MGSSVPKVLHRAAGRPLLDWVLDLAVAAGCDRSIVVVGHGGDEVRRCIQRPGVEFVVQSEQHGTGHAHRRGLFRRIKHADTMTGTRENPMP